MVYSPEDREKYLKGYAALTEFIGSSNWERRDHQGKKSLLQEIELNPVTDETVRDGYLHLKQQAIAFYLSSETIAENYLNYLPVPGEFIPCISLEETGGKAWAI